MTKPQLVGLFLGDVGLDAIGTEGDLGVVATLLGFVDPTRGSFPIVTP